MPHHHMYREIGPRPINLFITSDTSNVNLFTLAGSPSSAVVVTLTIASGIYCYASLVANFGLSVPAFPAGSVVKIINNGFIVGKGGGGGNGGNANGSGSAGAAGGDAINLGYSVTIDNTFGLIGGGGGGGGGGNGNDALGRSAGGGGGGGGQTRQADNGGSGGTGLTNGSNGNAGSTSGPGNGGASGGSDAVAGAKGGTWGKPGKGGSGAASGGGAGNAIDLNGFSVTWLGGNNGTQVLGTVA